MEALNNKMRERALADARWRQIQHDLDQSVGELCKDDSYDDLSKFIKLTMSLIFILLFFYFYCCQSDVHHSSAVNSHLPVGVEPVEVNSEEVDALRARYIQRLTAVLIHHIPVFWKTALSVFSGKFAKVF